MYIIPILNLFYLNLIYLSSLNGIRGVLVALANIKLLPLFNISRSVSRVKRRRKGYNRKRLFIIWKISSE